MRITLVVCGLCAACSSSSGATTLAANPCATKGATYLDTFTEHAGGTCGPLSPTIVNISAEGTVTSSTPISCAMMSQNGCTAQETDCTTESDGTTCSITTDVTFAADGASASGLETLNCTMGSEACASTYTLTGTRQ